MMVTTDNPTSPKMQAKLRVQLFSVSPISFSFAKPGDRARIEHKPPRKNEYREKIGPATDCYLVFKGQTKIGMIPKEFAEGNQDVLRKRVCYIEEMSLQESLVIVMFKD